MNYQVLGLTGQMAAGKDYVHQYLEGLMEDRGRRVRRMGFADGVRRELVAEVLGAFPALDLGDMSGAGIWAKPYTPGQRWLQQQWGTQYRREQDGEYWVKYGMQYIADNAEEGDLWVVTDVRFANEAQAIESLEHGTTAIVQAPVDVRAARMGIDVGELKARSQHASEVIDFDAQHTIDNFASDQPHLYGALRSWLSL